MAKKTPKNKKNRLFTSLREDPGFIPSPFPLSYSLTFYNSLSTKSIYSAFTMSQTMISAEDTLESKTDYHFCPHRVEGQWGETET